MTEPTSPQTGTPMPSMAEVAQESPEQSTAAEVDAVGDSPDVGGVLDDDGTQPGVSAPLKGLARPR